MAEDNRAKCAGRTHAGENPGRAQIRKVRHDGWTDERRETFLETLAETCNITAAARAAGKTAKTARDLRKRDTGFSEGWDEAIAIAYERLELVMLDRAIHGTERITVRGGSETKMRQYSDAVGIRLLQAHRDAAMRARERMGSGCDPEEAFEELKRRLAVMHERAKSDDQRAGRNE